MCACQSAALEVGSAGLPEPGADLVNRWLWGAAGEFNLYENLQFPFQLELFLRRVVADAGCEVRSKEECEEDFFQQIFSFSCCWRGIGLGEED